MKSGFSFSSIKRRALFYSAVIFCVPMCIMVGFSYSYLHRNQINLHHLQQQNTLNFCMQELENNIFYSKISELSNLSIIRNELYRLYRIVDMSVSSNEVEPPNTLSDINSNKFHLPVSSSPYEAAPQSHTSTPLRGYPLDHLPHENVPSAAAIADQAHLAQKPWSELSPDHVTSYSSLSSYGTRNLPPTAIPFNRIQGLQSGMRQLPINQRAPGVKQELGKGDDTFYQSMMPQTHSPEAYISDMQNSLELLDTSSSTHNQKMAHALNQVAQDLAASTQASKAPVAVAAEDSATANGTAVAADTVATNNTEANFETSRLTTVPGNNSNGTAVIDTSKVDSLPQAQITGTNLPFVPDPNSTASAATSELTPPSAEQTNSTYQLLLEKLYQDASNVSSSPYVVTAPAHSLNANDSLFAPKQASNTDRLILYKHLQQLQNLGFIAFSVNTTNPGQDLFIHEGYRDLLDYLQNDNRTLRELLYSAPMPDGGYFIILQNSKVDVDAEQSSALDYLQRQDASSAAERLGLYNSEHSEGTVTSSRQINDPDNDEQIPRAHDSSALNRSQLKNAARDSDIQAVAPENVTLIEAAADKADTTAAASTASAAGTGTASASSADKNSLSPTNAPDNITETAAVVDDTDAADMENGMFEPNLPPDNLEAQRHQERPDQEKHSTSMSKALTNGSSYLGIIANMDFAPNQILVIITDISKLQQQDEVLKRLIANSLNELVLSVGLTTPMSITLIDDEFNPLAGDLSKDEVTRLITPNVLEQTRENGMFQGYNSLWGHYLTTGYFKPYNWYVLINSDNVRATSWLWQYIVILFTMGLLFAIISVHLFGMLANRDVSDLNLINNRIKHMATLIQDPELINRISEGLPRRNDEIGTLASYIRLMSKTLYQSMQEVLRTCSKQSLDQGERLLADRIRQSSINREIFLKEYYRNHLNIHTETANESTGDFYDVIELNQGKKIAIFVGSINEHGLTAANISILNICLLRQMIRLTESIKLPLPKAVMEVNQNIAENNPKTILTSVCIFIIDQTTGHVEYLNAGHTLPILYHKDKGFEYIDIRTGPVLGAATNQNFTSITFDLKEDDSILMYTDGLLDCTNHRNEKLGQEGFESFLHDESFNTPEETVNSLDNKLKRYSKDSKLEKDYTLICYQYSKENSKPLN